MWYTLTGTLPFGPPGPPEPLGPLGPVAELPLPAESAPFPLPEP